LRDVVVSGYQLNCCGIRLDGDQFRSQSGCRVGGVADVDVTASLSCRALNALIMTLSCSITWWQRQQQQQLLLLLSLQFHSYARTAADLMIYCVTALALVDDW